METTVKPSMASEFSGINKGLLSDANRVIISVFLLFIFSFLLWMIKDVTIKADGKTIHMYTVSGNVNKALEKAGVKIQKDDLVQPGLDEELKHGTQIQVKRAVPVQLEISGKTISLKTAQPTVKAFLADKKIKLVEADRVLPGESAKITKDMKIKVIRVSSDNQVKEVDLPYSIEKVADNNIEVGFSKVVQTGEKGLEKQLIKVTYEDGKEVKREIVGRQTVKQPRNQVVAIGNLSVATRGGQTLHFKKAAVMTATAYTYTGHRTATGTTPHRGVVAVDPRVIPLGSKLYIEGYGYAIAEDTGGAIKGNIVDLFYETNSEVTHWGRRSVKIYILE